MWNGNEHISTNFHPGKIEKALCYNDVHTTYYGSKILCQFFIFMELDPFYYYFVITNTLNLSNVKYKWAYTNQYLPIKIYQRVYGTMISILQNMGETKCGNYSYLWRKSHFPNILWSHRHWIWVTWNGIWCIWTNIHL